ncbi:MAG TPA: hypothetical protein VFS00_08135, partial [Polyangiaceae bacterium]|nr:hypothetical protein [Polyangiaceae bacterium]
MGVIWLAACSTDEARVGGEPGGPDVFGETTRFATCEELEQRIEDLAVREMRHQFEPERWSYAHRNPPADASSACRAHWWRDADIVPTTAGQRLFVSRAFVDDGAHLFALAGERLWVLERAPTALRVVGSVAVPGSFGGDLSVAGGRAVIDMVEWFDQRFCAPGAARPEGLVCPQPPGRLATRLTVVDVSRPEQPAIETEVHVDGEAKVVGAEGSSL